MAKNKIDKELFNRAKDAAEAAGYSSVEEFVTYIIETEVAKNATSDTDDQVEEQLRGLGYIE